MQATTRPLTIVATPIRKFLPATAKAITLNYLSAASLLLVVYTIYAALFQFVPYYNDLVTPTGMNGITYVLVGYLCLLPIFYATFPDEYTVKCRRFWQGVFALRTRPLDETEKVALRAVAVKAFYLPLMIAWVISHFENVIASAQAIQATGYSFRNVYMLLFFVILIGDVGCYTIGYAVEHPRLKNEIRSVEPTIFGWLVALICYPPLVILTRRVLGSYGADYPEFNSIFLQVTFGIVFLILIAIYSWSSVALGFKASNLTHRGIVASGPYAYVRHPAYVSKNLLWCVSTIPLFVHHGVSDPRLILAAVFGLSGCFGIYYLRAITEERHLGKDPAYVEYCQRVKWRFVPGVW
jgi:protein-S-isoprenylcysteine O-methyltransferase Ste14